MPGPPGRRPAALLTVAAAVLLTGCGHAGGSDQVRHYIERANAIQQRAAPQIAAANATYGQFARNKLAPGQAIRRLESAEATIRATRRRLAALAAPPLALGLRHRLLALFDADAGLAHEATLMARYLPGASRTRAAVNGAGRRLQAGLRRARTPAAQSQALRRYGRDLTRADTALRELSPPPVLEPAHQAQLLRLEATEHIAQRLRAALSAGDARAVAALLTRFRAQSAASARAGGQAAISRAATRAYVRRYRHVNALLGALRREQQRLQRTLG